jgi:replicative DNA helicase
MGKTALAVNLACNNLRSGRSVLFFSFEMTAQQILERLVGCWGMIAVKNILGHYGKETLAQIQKAGEEIAQKPFYVAESMKPSLESLEQVLVQHAAKFGPPDLVVVDYLQLMTSMRRFDNRNQELSHISRGLKTLAMKAKLPMLVISQLRRSSQHNTVKNPQIDDLRDSGAIEADADAIILLGLETITNAGNDVILKLNVAKNRHGQAGVCQVKFRQNVQHIQDVTWSPEAERVEELEPEEELPF